MFSTMFSSDLHSIDSAQEKKVYMSEKYLVNHEL